MRPAASPVKRRALERGIDVFQPPTLKSSGVLDRLRASRPEVIVVAAYGLLLPQAVLEAAPYGALNVHASLLPRWRGAAPIPRAILAGDRETGVSIMQMDEGLDTGPLLRQEAIAITPDDTARSLHDAIWHRRYWAGSGPALLSIALVGVMQLAFTYWPLSQEVFSLAPLAPAHWLILVAATSPILLLVELEKAWLRHAHRRVRLAAERDGGPAR